VREDKERLHEQRGGDEEGKRQRDLADDDTAAQTSRAGAPRDAPNARA